MESKEWVKGKEIVIKHGSTYAKNIIIEYSFSFKLEETNFKDHCEIKSHKILAW